MFTAACGEPKEHEAEAAVRRTALMSMATRNATKAPGQLGSAKGPLRATVAVGNDNGAVMVTIRIVGRGIGHRILTHAASHKERLRHGVERLVDRLLTSPSPTASIGRLTSRIELAAEEKLSAKSTVECKWRPQSAIRAHISVRLTAELARRAEESKLPFARLLSETFERGLQSFNERLWKESSRSVVDDLRTAHAQFELDERKELDLQMSRRSYLKTVLLAKEHRVEPALLAIWCITASVGLHEVAQVSTPASVRP